MKIVVAGTTDLREVPSISNVLNNEVAITTRI